MKRFVLYIISAVFILCSLCGAWFAYKENEPFGKANIQKRVISYIGKWKENEETYGDKVDFKCLKEINTDICGWIYIPDTSVDYPILIGDTDEKYLYTDVEGNPSKLGSIFSFSDTDRTLKDARIILFGHNMKEYQMFGELKRYIEDEEFRNNHKKIYIYAEDKIMELEVFSIFICEETDSIFRDSTRLGSKEYKALLQELADRDQYFCTCQENMENGENQQSVSLVTCSGSVGTKQRLVVSAIAGKV